MPMNGIINVYKEKGFTSHDVVAKLRGILHQKKIGHTGTLDPDAEGVLPICVGNATKVCDLLTDRSKTYRTVLLLGSTTDTQDVTGNVLRERPVFCSKEDVIRCVESFTGEQQQIPPMYSALKVNGRKLYELARQGIEVERSPRTITIEEIRIERIELPEVELTVRCSKGTYIRTLCNDIGESLGCGGCMKELLRTQAGSFLLEDARRLDEIEALCREGRLEEAVYPVDSVFMRSEAVVLTPEAERLVRNGNPLSFRLLQDCRRLEPGERPVTGSEVRSCENSMSASGESADRKPNGRVPDKEQMRIYGQSGEFLALYAFHRAKHSWRAVKMFLP